MICFSEDELKAHDAEVRKQVIAEVADIIMRRDTRFYFASELAKDAIVGWIERQAKP